MAISLEAFQTMAVDFAYSNEDAAVTHANNALAKWADVATPLVNYTLPRFDTARLTGFRLPVADTFPTIAATQPTAPELGDIAAVQGGNAPVFTSVAPHLDLPAAPAATMPVAPGSPPEFHLPTLPEPPQLRLPDAPQIQGFELDALPEVSLPRFESTLPVDTLVAPTAQFAFAESPYQSALLDASRAKLLRDLVDGGYGIEVHDEESLWQRARERELRNAEGEIRIAVRETAAQGFLFPPGALAATIGRKRQAAMEKMSSLSRDIALKRADLYVDNRKFTFQAVHECEQMLIAYWGAMMERALNAEKAVVETAFKTYEALRSKAQYRLDSYRAEAEVYQTVLRAALSSLEVYKLRIEGKQLDLEAQKAHVEIYRSQIENVQAAMNLYRTRLEGVRIIGDIEQMKLAAFKSSVEAYTAQVGAKNAEFSLYDARVKGELAKLNVFQSELDAYGKQVSAYGVRQQALHTELESRLAPARLKLEKYRTDIEKYSADLKAAQAGAQLVSMKYDTAMRGFEADVRLAESNVGVWRDTAKLTADMAVADARLKADMANATAQVSLSTATGFANTQATLSQSFSHLSAAALNTLSSLEAHISGG